MIDIDFTITREDILRARVTLAQIAGESDRLGAELKASGIASFADRADWLIGRRSPDERLAWSRRWRALGVRHPEPQAEHFERTPSLAAPKPRPARRPHKFEPWQLAVAARWAERNVA